MTILLALLWLWTVSFRCETFSGICDVDSMYFTSRVRYGSARTPPKDDNHKTFELLEQQYKTMCFAS